MKLPHEMNQPGNVASFVRMFGLNFLKPLRSHGGTRTGCLRGYVQARTGRTGVYILLYTAVAV
jgi:hypothetical protein